MTSSRYYEVRAAVHDQHDDYSAGTISGHVYRLVVPHSRADSDPRWWLWWIVYDRACRTGDLLRRSLESV